MSLPPFINAAILVDSLQRIPEAYQRQSFFGHLDLWDYVAFFDEKLCDRCSHNVNVGEYRGSELRGKFPYLEILDENTIAVKEHPHCRCKLWRITYERYQEVLEKLEAR